MTPALIKLGIAAVITEEDGMFVGAGKGPTPLGFSEGLAPGASTVGKPKTTNIVSKIALNHILSLSTYCYQLNEQHRYW